MTENKPKPRGKEENSNKVLKRNKMSFKLVDLTVSARAP